MRGRTREESYSTEHKRKEIGSKMQNSCTVEAVTGEVAIMSGVGSCLDEGGSSCRT